MLRALLSCFILALPLHAEQKPPQAITEKVVGVHDGDTLTVLTVDKAQVKVRLDGIDAPESKQAFGMKSRLALSVELNTILLHVHGLRTWQAGWDLCRPSRRA